MQSNLLILTSPKICNRCNLQKPLSEYTFRKESQQYLNICKKCTAQALKIYRKKYKYNNEKISKINKIYYQKNKQKILKRVKRNYQNKKN